MRGQDAAGPHYLSHQASRLNPSPCLMIAAAAVIVGLISAGCSALGYVTGCAIDCGHRETVPVSRLHVLPAHQEVRLTLGTGETISGRLAANQNPDSLSIEFLPTVATTDPFVAKERRVLAREDISRIEVPASHYRWLGLAVGATADLTIVYLAASSDHSFHTYPAMTPAGGP